MASKLAYETERRRLEYERQLRKGVITWLKQNKGIDRVCSPMIWEGMYDQNFKKMLHVFRREINTILRTLPELTEYKSKTKFEKYGSVVGFYRKTNKRMKAKNAAEMREIRKAKTLKRKNSQKTQKTPETPKKLP